MAIRNRASRLRYRIIMSDGATVTDVSKEVFESHLAAHRIEQYKHDERRAATVEGWLSYVHFQSGELIFAERETAVGVYLDSNWQSILNNLKYLPPFDEWTNMQNAQVYERAGA